MSYLALLNIDVASSSEALFGGDVQSRACRHGGHSGDIRSDLNPQKVVGHD